ncbi:MAG: carbohydrate ABC transporter permease [Nitrososphaeria archaeon]
MKLSNSKYGLLISLPGLIFLFLIIVVPLGMLVSTSFLRYDFIHPIEFIGFENYHIVLGGRLFWLALQNTVVYTVGVTVLTFALGLILALANSRIRMLSGFFRTLLILPWAVPAVVSGLVWRWMLDPGVGVVNYTLMQIGLLHEPVNIFGNPSLAMTATIVGYVWTAYPFMFVLVLAGIEAIPRELYEAAKVDGAKLIHSFRYITLPLARKSILVGVLITSMFSFRTIDTIWSMTRGGPARSTYVIGFNLLEYLIDYQNIGFASAVAIIMLLLIMVYALPLMYYVTKE